MYHAAILKFLEIYNVVNREMQFDERAIQTKG